MYAGTCMPITCLYVCMVAYMYVAETASATVLVVINRSEKAQSYLSLGDNHPRALSVP